MIVVMTTWLPRQACSAAGTAAQAMPNSIAATHHQRQQQRRAAAVRPSASAASAGAEPAEHRLAFAADVEQPAVEGDRDGEAGEDEGGRVVQRVAEAGARCRTRP